MAATRIIIRPELSVWPRINFVCFIARARAKKFIFRRFSPRDNYRNDHHLLRGPDFNPCYVFDAISSRFFDAEDYASCSVQGKELSTHGWTKKKGRIGATVERRVEKSRGFSGRPAFSLRSCQYSGSTRVPREIVLSGVFAPKTGFRRSARSATGGKRPYTNLTVTNRIRRLTDS